MVNQKIIKNRIFLVKFSPISFIFIGFRIEGIGKILGATRNCGRWFNIEAIKLPDIRYSHVRKNVF